MAYDIAGRFTSLSGTVAINNDKRCLPLSFRIVGDGRVLWRSKPIGRGRQEFSVLVRGVRKLELFVDCSGANRWAHAVWVEPQLH